MLENLTMNINLRQLRTFLAIAEQGTFLAAGDAVGLSHSAVSLHVKALEEELGVKLVDRSRRPPSLTNRGLALVDCSRRMLDLMDEISVIAAEADLIGSINAGVVPSAMTHLIPPALAALRYAHPRLKVRIHTGLSGELATRVRSAELDVAIATAPIRPLDGIAARTIISEPLFIIAHKDTPETSVVDLLTTQPFIWFNRKTWAGQHIEQLLLKDGIIVGDDMEVDSIIAIEALVSHGIGVAIVPQRPGTRPFSENIRCVPFGTPQHRRELAMLERSKTPKRRLTDALFEALTKIPRTNSAA